MNERAHDRDDPSRGRRLMRRELRTYIIGYLLAMALTLVPFAVVHWRVMVPRSVYYLIGAFGLVQMVVHFRCFLHIGLKQKREDLELIIFTTMLLILIIGGTLWVMFNLAERMMMPGSP